MATRQKQATRERQSTAESPNIEALSAEDKETIMAAARRQLAEETPSLEPPRAEGGVALFAGGPSALPEELLREAPVSVPGAAPTLIPPTEVEIEAAEVEGVAAWYNSKKITALWSNDSDRNSYIAVPGMGWKKLSNANDSSVVSMTMLAAHAEQTNANVNIRIEADGMVHEIYVW